MALPDTYYTAQAATAKAVTVALNKTWKRVSPNDLDGSWALVQGEAVSAIMAGQVRAAAVSELFLERTLADAGLDPTADARVPAVAYAGYTSAGIPLDTTVDTAPLRVKKGLLGGSTLADAMVSGLARLMMIGATEVQDAGRGSMQVNMGLEKRIAGYERKVRLPACGRCTILAGRLYTWSQGFQRHPRCDCVHIPVTSKEWREANPENTPEQLFHKMSKADQDQAFGKHEAELIRNGANPGQVVNARRGMNAPGELFTTEGTTVRGVAGTRLAQRGTQKIAGERYRRATQARLSPQGIARIAGSDREQLQQLLADNGYLL